MILVNLGMLIWQFMDSDADLAPAKVVSYSNGSSDVQRLVLLSEVDSSQVMSVEVPSDQVVSSNDTSSEAQSEPEGEGICELVGPFAVVSNAEIIVQRLAALDVVAEVVELSIPGDMTYWVYQGPFVTQKEAVVKLYELQATGIDSYVIPKGDLANSISFGVFTRKEGAEQKFAEIKSLGLSVDIHEVQRTDTEIWVMLSRQDAEKLADSAWLSILDHSDSPQRRQNYCSGVASS